MEMESEGFTLEDVRGFIDGYLDVDRRNLARRLEAAAERLAGLEAHLVAAERSSQPEGWSAVEVLAHLAQISKGFGALSHLVGTGKLTEFDLLPRVRQRDAADAEMGRRPVEEMVTVARDNLSRTAAYVRGAPVSDLKRTVVIGEGLTVTSFDIARLFVCAHVEDHLDQLQRALAESDS